MKVRVSMSFDHDVKDQRELDHLLDLVSSDPRFADIVTAVGGNNAEVTGGRRRDRQPKTITREEAAA